MAMEPINIFSRRIDPRGVLSVLRSLDPDVRIAGPDDDWQEASITVTSGGGESLTLTFLHDSEYYDGSDWPRQMLGMQGYFSQFPDVESKPEVLRLIGTFRFSLATDWQPDLDPEGDERLDFLFAVTEHLDGVLFTPSTLRDAQGRILIGADGETDPEAVFPQIPVVVEPAAAEESEADLEDDEDPEPEPPPVDRIVRRALALTAVTARALAEQSDPSEEGMEDYRQDILHWARALKVEDELEPDEWKVLQRPVGQLDRQAMINATWRLEGLAVLAWALGRFDLPAYDQLVDPQQLLHAMCFLEEHEAQALLSGPQLRPQEEIAELQDQLFALHWRLRNYTLDQQAMDFEDFAKTCWFGPLDIRPYRLIGGDLALGEYAIADAPDDVFFPALSATQERHQAINWLNWGGEIYSETDTST